MKPTFQDYWANEKLASKHNSSYAAILKGHSDIPKLIGRDVSEIIWAKGSREIHAGGGNDSVSGNSGGNDTLHGDAGHDKLIGYRGSDTFQGGTGDDLLFGDSWNPLYHFSGTDTAVYKGKIGDFLFTEYAWEFSAYTSGVRAVVNYGFFDRLVLTDQNLHDGINEGRDHLYEIEVIRFGDGVTINVEDIHFGEGATAGNVVTVTGGDQRDIFYGEGGGYRFVGGDGADTFQFLTAEDSTEAMTTTIADFNAAEGDTIVFADGVEGLQYLSVTTADGNTVILNENEKAGFYLVLEGLHDLVAGVHYRHAGNEDPTKVGGIRVVPKTLTTGQRIEEIPIDDDVHVTDEDGDEITYSAKIESGGDLGLSFTDLGFGIDPLTGTVSGVFTGTKDVMIDIFASDGKVPIMVQRLDIKANAAPFASDSPLEDVVEYAGSEIESIDVDAAFDDGSAKSSLTYEVTGLLEGLSFNKYTREIAGTVAEVDAGVAEVTVVAMDRDGASFAQSFRLSVGLDLFLNASRNTRFGSEGDDFIYAEGRFNTLRGLDGNDIIHGNGEHRNILDGGAGDDVIIGEGASNYLTGGEGSDTFEVHNTRENWSGEITDFAVGEDEIEFHGFSAEDVSAEARGRDFVFSTTTGMELTVVGLTSLDSGENGDYVFI